MSFIRSQRETWTTSGASAGGAPPSRATCARRSTRRGSGRPSGAREVRRRQHAEHRLAVERLVLRGERVDRGRDHREPALVHPPRREPAPREDEPVGLLDVRPDELPRPLRPLVRVVEADVAAPHDGAAVLEQRRDEPCRLRVVDDHDVVGPYRVADPGEVRRECALVGPALGGPELASVAGPAVEPVVDPLRDREELGVALDHEPLRLEPGPAHVPEQGLQHLRDPAARRRRVDVDDAPTCEELAQLRRPSLEPIHSVRTDERLQPARVERWDRDRADACGRGHVRSRLRAPAPVLRRTAASTLGPGPHRLAAQVTALSRL